MAENIYSLTLSYNISGQFAQNIVHWRFDDAGYGSTHAAADGLITAFDGSRKALLMGCLPNVTTLTSMKSRRTTLSGGLEAAQPMTVANVGTRAGGISAAAVSPCVIGYPALPTTRNRARIFLAGVRELDLVNGIFTAAYKTAVSGAFATLFDPLTLAGGGSPVATFVINNASAAFAIVITDWQLSDAVGQLRRRQVPV